MFYGKANRWVSLFLKTENYKERWQHRAALGKLVKLSNQWVFFLREENYLLFMQCVRCFVTTEPNKTSSLDIMGRSGDKATKRAQPVRWFQLQYRWTIKKLQKMNHAWPSILSKQSTGTTPSKLQVFLIFEKEAESILSMYNICFLLSVHWVNFKQKLSNTVLKLSNSFAFFKLLQAFNPAAGNNAVSLTYEKDYPNPF